jgi:hypothetical protein
MSMIAQKADNVKSISRCLLPSPNLRAIIRNRAPHGVSSVRARVLRGSGVVPPAGEARGERGRYVCTSMYAERGVPQGAREAATVLGNLTRGLVLFVLMLSVGYTAVILGLVLLLRTMGVSARRAIMLGFLVFGIVTGVISALAWPLDSSVYPNLWGTLLGDWAYNLSHQYFGDPWVLQVPQVYIAASIALAAAIGLPLQWMFNRRKGLGLTEG